MLNKARSQCVEVYTRIDISIRDFSVEKERKKYKSDLCIKTVSCSKCTHI